MTEAKKVFIRVLGEKFPHCPKEIPIEMLSEEMAQTNHGQTLLGLSERGGLSPDEMIMNIEGKKMREHKWDEVESITKLIKYLKEYNDSKDSESNTNETAVDKLRNKLSPHYGLPEMIFVIDEHPKMKGLIIEQARQAKMNKKRIDELLVEIEADFDIKKALDKLSDNERLDIISSYCKHCGSKNPGCQCWNDD